MSEACCRCCERCLRRVVQKSLAHMSRSAAGGQAIQGHHGLRAWKGGPPQLTPLIAWPALHRV